MEQNPIKIIVNIDVLWAGRGKNENFSMLLSTVRELEDTKFWYAMY